MTRRTLIPGLLLGLCLVLILWQRNAIGAARRVQADLLAARARAAQLAGENAELSRAPSSRGTNSVVDFTELLRLRNEVRQLRTIPQEVARVRAANEQAAAAAAAATAPAAPGELAEMEGYRPKESWNEAGLGSPEATVESFFRAVRDLEVPRLLQCLSEKGSYALDLRLDAKAGQLRPSSADVLRTFNLVQGYRIETQKIIDPEQIELSLRAKTGGSVLVLTLRKYAEEWKIER